MIKNNRIVVLGRRAHAIPVEEYVDEISQRLPEYDIVTARTADEERESFADASIVTGMKINEESLDRAEELPLFACGSAGIGHLPLRALEERGTTVTNVSGVHGPNIAEHVTGWILMFTRRLDEGMRRKQQGVWKHFKAYELQGSTVTVVGLGSIGEAIIDRLEGFGVETFGVRYSPEKGGPTDEVIGFNEESFYDALVRTDYLVFACPLTETTKGLIGEEEFRVLPPDAVLVNVGRGPIVDTDAIVTTIRRNELRGAALDVTDPEPLPEGHPLWEFDNVQITPHSSGHTPMYWSRLANILSENDRLIEDTGEYDGLRNQVLSP
jgi:phosphoglycerate dehydrogenase-like enzyme